MNKLFFAIIALVVVIGGYLILSGDKNSVSDMDGSQYQTSQTETASTETTADIQTAPAETTTSVTPAETSPKATTTTTSVKTPTSGYTLAQIAQHADSTSCYSTVNGMVYDLTKWITRHPGGQREILAICGRDGSSAFNGQHGGDARPEQLLAGFEIGVLIK